MKLDCRYTIETVKATSKQTDKQFAVGEPEYIGDAGNGMVGLVLLFCYD